MFEEQLKDTLLSHQQQILTLLLTEDNEFQSQCARKPYLLCAYHLWK